ncbi:MAG: FtsX-like permease family protein [Chloroflexi bacterium]|nr:FtsX-like permease family protein [Chloroflexota bacterium]
MLGGLAWRAWRWPIFLRLGVRQLPRRPAQTALVVAGLTLSTTLVAAALSTGDTLTHSLRAAAIGEIGYLDELVTFSALPRQAAAGSGDPFGSTSFFSTLVYERIRQQLDADSGLGRYVAAAAPAIWLDCRLLDVTSRQTAGASVRALPHDYDRRFGELVDAAGNELSLAGLRPGEVYLNEAGGVTLAAKPGDELTCTVAGVPQRWRVKAITAARGLGAASAAAVFLPLDHLQAMLGSAAGDARDPINQIWIANRGPDGRADPVRSAAVSERVVRALRPLLIDPEAMRDIKTSLRRDDVRAALAARRAALPERTQDALAEALRLAGGDGDPAELERPLRSPAARAALLAAARELPDKDAAQDLAAALERATGFRIFPLKREILTAADRAGNAITTIFLLFSVLSIAAGLLLVFLVFSLLAAARRSELGIARALGTERGHLIATFTFEGAAYALLAGAVGVPAGLGVSRLLVALLLRAVESGAAGFSGAAVRVAETVTWRVEPRSIILAAALGFLLTVTTVAVAAWRVSRVTIVTAIRDLPDPPARRKRRTRASQMTRVLDRLAPQWWMALLPGGVALAATGVYVGKTVWFALGASALVLFGGGVLHRVAARRWGHTAGTRLGATVAGVGLAGYWALPFDAQQFAGLPRLSSGIEIFALAGLLMVAGAVGALCANSDLMLRFLYRLLTALARPAPALRLAAAHALRFPFRTGVTATMFALVIFTLAVMQVITASATHFQADPYVAYGGWDIRAETVAATPATPLPKGEAAQREGGGSDAPPDAGGASDGGGPHPNPLPGEKGAAHRRPLVEAALGDDSLRPFIRAAGSRTSGFFALLQLSAPSPAWGGYAVAAVDEPFAAANEIALQTRARGYATDREAWLAVARGGRLAIVDRGVLPSPELRGYPSIGTYSFTLHGVDDGQTSMEPVDVWIGNPTGGAAQKVTVIGIVDRRTSPAFRGLHVSPDVFASLGTPLRPPVVRYYFRLQPGADVNTARAALGATFFDEGLQTTDLAERFQNQSGPLLLASRLLQLFVSLGLAVGVAALGVISMRAALERRQEIGVLRAIGCSRQLIGAGLLLESAFVVVMGSTLGVALALVLCQNVFAVQFFDRFQQGMRMVVPWDQVALTVAATCVVALAATWLPARAASRIPPMAALRAE